jgi:nicotinamidase-related amidase
MAKPTSALAQVTLSRLVVIDMQDKIAGVMQSEAMGKVLKHCGILLEAAAALEIPTLYTEQYPQGLGATLPTLAERLQKSPRVEKTTFSCCAEPTFCRQLTGDRPQIILVGMEAHICVLQTALQLKEQGHQVFVVEDAIISRDPANKANAIARLHEAGVIVSNTESVIFEWLGKAEGEAFKQISRLIR